MALDFLRSLTTSSRPLPITGGGSGDPAVSPAVEAEVERYLIDLRTAVETFAALDCVTLCQRLKNEEDAAYAKESSAETVRGLAAEIEELVLVKQAKVREIEERFARQRQGILDRAAEKELEMTGTDEEVAAQKSQLASEVEALLRPFEDEKKEALRKLDEEFQEIGRKAAEAQAVFASKKELSPEERVEMYKKARDSKERLAFGGSSSSKGGPLQWIREAHAVNFKMRGFCLALDGFFITVQQHIEEGNKPSKAWLDRLHALIEQIKPSINALTLFFPDVSIGAVLQEQHMRLLDAAGLLDLLLCQSQDLTLVNEQITQFIRVGQTARVLQRAEDGTQATQRYLKKADSVMPGSFVAEVDLRTALQLTDAAVSTSASAGAGIGGSVVSVSSDELVVTGRGGVLLAAMGAAALYRVDRSKMETTLAFVRAAKEAAFTAQHTAQADPFCYASLIEDDAKHLTKHGASCTESTAYFFLLNAIRWTEEILAKLAAYGAAAGEKALRKLREQFETMYVGRVDKLLAAIPEGIANSGNVLALEQFCDPADVEKLKRIILTGNSDIVNERSRKVIAEAEIESVCNLHFTKTEALEIKQFLERYPGERSQLCEDFEPKTLASLVETCSIAECMAKLLALLALLRVSPAEVEEPAERARGDEAGAGRSLTLRLR